MKNIPAAKLDPVTDQTQDAATHPLASTPQTGNQRGDARAALDAVGIEAIAEQIAECVTYRKIAEDAGVSAGSLSNWLALPANAATYALAREARADRLAEEILAIADDGSNDTFVDSGGEKRTDHDAIARSKLRVDARKWLASKMFPSKYGDKLDVKTNHTPSPLDAAFARLLEKGSALPIGTGATMAGEACRVPDEEVSLPAA